MKKLTVGIVVLALALFAQTRIRVANIMDDPGPGAWAVIVLDGHFRVARLDPASLALDTTATPPVLRATATGSGGGQPEEEVFKPTAPAPAITLRAVPLPKTLQVVVAGIVMTAGEDYALGGQVISFLPGTQPMAGDVVRITYRY